MSVEKLSKEELWAFIPKDDKYVAGVYDSGAYLTVKLNDYAYASSWGLLHMHRYLMQQHLGRRLEKFEHVHHKDGNKKNNNMDNLEILIDHDHTVHHSTERTKNIGKLVRKYICPMCEKIFEKRDNTVTRLARTCSYECKNEMCSRLNLKSFTERNLYLIKNNYIGQYRFKDGVYNELAEDDPIFREIEENSYCKECGIEIKRGGEYCKEHHLKNKVHVKLYEDNFCACGKLIDHHVSQCKECYLKSMSTNENFLRSAFNNRKVERPSKEILEDEIKNNSLLSLGRKYGVSDNAIRKWCKSYGIDLKLSKNSFNK